MWWFLGRRDLSAVEVALGAWVAWVALYVFWAARWFELGSNSLKPALALTWTLPVVVFVALFRLALTRQWKALRLFFVMAVVLAPFSGMLQFERCPHAIYVQVMGISLPVHGMPCGNPRRVEPWWMRE